MKHFISLLDLSLEELTEILNRADYLQQAWKENSMPQSLKNKQVGLWFFGNGFRNRLAFEIGARAMGAAVSYIPGELGIHEPLEDVGPYLENWYSMLVVRAKKHEDLLYLKENRKIPIINARTNLGHPCEIMGDLQFIRKYRGSLDNLNVVFVGEVTNLSMSWFEAAVKFPIKVTQVAPKGYELDEKTRHFLNEKATGRIEVSNDFEGSLTKVDLIYTDCWPKADNKEEQEEIRKKFLPYQVTEKHLQRLSNKAIFLPCPPVTRGEEVSEGAMKSELCLNYKAKEYLLHSQNAILELAAQS